MRGKYVKKGAYRLKKVFSKKLEGRFGYVVLTARYFYVTALVHLTKDFDDLIYSVSFLFHDSGRVLARQSLIFNGPVYGGQVTYKKDNKHWIGYGSVPEDAEPIEL